MVLEDAPFTTHEPLLRPLANGGCQLPPIRPSLRALPPTTNMPPLLLSSVSTPSSRSPPKDHHSAIAPYPSNKGGTTNTLPMNPRRHAHIISEQKRRENINAGFDELKGVVPSCTNTTDSKATILKKAAEHIRKLQSQIDQLRQEIGQVDYHQHHNHPAPDIPLNSSALPMLSPSMMAPLWQPKLESYGSDVDLDGAFGPPPGLYGQTGPATAFMARSAGSLRDYSRRREER
ncbi:Myc-type, basic helix-loop-helix domain-containing protein [Jimgerdemannia flammicorona]|uniref:Myc-type, basic helix-loop-helix domain-containing protein n=2 Tax=Jimgerdemannia flammicorona TaxID=994334 RepID=A0A433DDC5_9FUNG|nr:Myc-type, basic helix-loop-helix domain-containing protein [Jimgerdemannia flammicorona]RUS32013.1 Myc-type, basic helix-loop-helix domain-containing protein [Jimgerdemannia flammicorona]